MATIDPHMSTPASVTPPASRGSQLSMGMLAMIFFLGSEAMLFASFFTAYFFVRFNVADQWPPDGPNGEPYELPIIITGINTLILVSSSFTMHWAEHRFRDYGDRVALRRGLIVTIFLGATFLLLQLNEYAHLDFTPQSGAFGSTFFTLTGLHGLHVLVGLTILWIMLRRVVVAHDFKPTWFTPLGAGALYWHFVDVVWVILYLLVYIL